MASIASRRKLFGAFLLSAIAGISFLEFAPAARGAADSSSADGATVSTFNIPAQPMSSALNALAIQANVQMFFEEATVSGLQAPAVVGQMSTMQALAALIGTAPLEVIQNADGTYMVRPKHPHRQVANKAPAPAVAAAPSPVVESAIAPPPPPVPPSQDWIIRLRGVYVDPKNESDPLITPASAPVALPRNAVHANGLVHPELDLEYFFVPHFSAELALEAPRPHSFGVNGAGAAGGSSFGTFDWMTNFLTLKYDLLTSGPFRPYVGGGVNVSTIWNVTAAPFGLSSTSVGPAAQAGFDLKLGGHWFFNIDAKWARVRPELRYDGEDIARPRFDPMFYGVGIGYRFGKSAPPPAPAPAPVVDSDGDGVPDTIDQCPNTPHGVAVDAKGCPLDTDGDGVPDYLDKCPNTPPGVKVDAQGCPLDTDGDGVPDYLDKCPGTPPGLKVDANGCEIEELVLRGVNFETASAKLTSDSAAVLDGVVAILNMRPNARAEIHGYTDSVGKDAYNQKLSERRAQSVIAYLVDHGIPASGLTARGFGKADPIATNATAEGRAQNRRVTVEFKSPVPR
jgi:outer membrane protein OmpA-like peptidoglycan-associated protein/outer membrane protein W